MRLLGVLLSALLALPALGQPPLEIPGVPPGALVTWPGEGITRCGMSGAKWDPLAGACWYPLDLLTPAGTLELGRWVGGVLETRRVRIAEYPYPVQHIKLTDDSRVDLSAEDLARVGRENALIGRLWTRRGEARFLLPLTTPLERMPEGGRFGARRFFNGQPRSPHSGADYAAQTGTAVRAVADGEVALTGDFFFSGRSVFLDHGDGLVTMYFHLDRVEVEPGAQVRRGQTIGGVGQSGRATGPHLHFAARWRGARVDPELLLRPAGATRIR